jgi:hypothetical protein
MNQRLARCAGAIVTAVVIGAIRGYAGGGSTADPCVLTGDISGGGVPSDVDKDCQQSFKAFSDYSWKAFLSLTRAALPDKRGEINPDKPVGATASPLVFESYKALWEVFREGKVPANWESVPLAAESPCPTADVEPGDLLLSSYSKLEDVWQVKGVNDYDGPLVAQNGTVVRYATAYNRIAFEAIAAKQLYREDYLGTQTKPEENLPATIQLPDGSIAVKSAWMILNDKSGDASRYRTRNAWVRDLGGQAGTTSCTEKDVALVGLHIMQKTHNNPQWIWTTFEHVDNLDLPEATAPLAFHDGVSAKGSMPATNPNVKKGKLAVPPIPFVVERARPVHLHVTEANKMYAAKLKSAGVVWKNYRLVMTQWPRSALQPKTQADSIPGGTVLEAPKTTSFANPVFETFFQNPAPSVFGCMQCHNAARDASDYLWSPVMHAWAPASTDLKRRRLLIKELADQLDAFRSARKPQ